MKSDKFAPSLFIAKKGELDLSGNALTELILAVLDKGIPFRFKAKGFSMSPFIRDNDIITVSPLESTFLHNGAIVVFTHPDTGKLYVHRIIKKDGNYYFIKGDNVSIADGFIPQKNIIGFVSRIERKGKRKFLGLGPERILIAYFSSNRLSQPFLYTIKKILYTIKNKKDQNV